MEDVCHLHSERALLSLLGMARIPSADAMGDWLRRIGRGGGGRKLLERLNAHVLGVTLGDRRSVSPSFRHGRQDHPSCPSGGAENAVRILRNWDGDSTNWDDRAFSASAIHPFQRFI